VSEINKNKIFQFIEDLFPLCRSITGSATRKTLKYIQDYVPIELFSVPSGMQVFDWTVPEEWNISDAFIKDMDGNKIVDFNENNLHVLNYSRSIHETMRLEKLKKHIYTMPEHPEWIPYRTSYYEKNWGFCMRHSNFEQLNEGEYEVKIDSNLESGKLNYGELYIDGESEQEVLFSTYICHPSMCNDNLTGPAILTFLAKNLLEKDELKYNYRFLFIPETIGAITWLSQNEDKIDNIKGGLVATCLGDEGDFTYKKTRSGESYIDKVSLKTLKDLNFDYEVMDFFPWGSDERQYSSPAFQLDMGSIMKTPYGQFPEYHTSADNLEFISSDSLYSSLEAYLKFVKILENDKFLINTNPKCEPNLGDRGLYDKIGAAKDSNKQKHAIFWLLNLSDGSNSLLDIAMLADMDFEYICETAKVLAGKGLLSAKE